MKKILNLFCKYYHNIFFRCSNNNIDIIVRLKEIIERKENADCPSFNQKIRFVVIRAGMHGMDMNSKGLDYTILTIAIIGAINWGLIGFFRLDLVAFLFGDMTLLSRIIYAAVGICGLYLISMFGRVRDIAE